MIKYFSLVLTLMISGCAGMHQDVVFSDPARLRGQTVTISGFLMFEFENMNLYPIENWEVALIEDQCLPVAVLSDREQLLADARSMTGKWVELEGRIEDVVTEGRTSNSHCKTVGLLLESLSQH